jgi:hypothetical protein
MNLPLFDALNAFRKLTLSSKRTALRCIEQDIKLHEETEAAILAADIESRTIPHIQV